MVLDDITGGSDAVVITSPTSDANILCHGDLDVRNVMVIPNRLEDLVGEPERHDVLDGLFAQVVVNAEYRFWAEGAADDLVEIAGTFQIVSEGFLNDDSAPVRGVVAGHAMTFELAYDRFKRPRRDRQVEGVITPSASFLIKFADGVS